jgi:hypothetical protein
MVARIDDLTASLQAGLRITEPELRAR